MGGETTVTVASAFIPGPGGKWKAATKLFRRNVFGVNTGWEFQHRERISIIPGEDKVYATCGSPRGSHASTSSNRNKAVHNPPRYGFTNLAVDERTILMKVLIDCPVCYSGNTFETKNGDEMRCNDCGFLLAQNGNTSQGRCIFCGNGRFYFSSPFGLPFLGRDSVCYVCGAGYKKTRINSPEPRFSDQSFQHAQQSPYAEQFKERARGWH